MSMVSAQCNHLKTAAAYMVVHDMPDVAADMRDAADTILELRDDLQRANDALRDAEHDESRAWDRVVKVESENDKLRELCADMWREGAFEPGACYEKAAGELEERTRELGVEVAG